jgi:hypothetical protein
MPSNAHTTYLIALLADAKELEQAHQKLRTKKQGRQWGLGSLNRAVVVISVSAWEAYVEEVVKEAIELLKPSALPLGSWPALKAQAQSETGRFNTPNPKNVKRLVADYIGLQDITVSWSWRN